MAITTEEIAQLSGVSRATVDRVLNNRGGVKKATEEKILAISKEHGYRPNYIARSLVTGKTHSIGVVIPNLRNTFYASLLNEITIHAHNLKYSTIVQIYQDTPENEVECVYNLYDRNVDGIIILSTQKEQNAVELFEKLDIPVVALCNTITGLTCVKPNYKQATIDAIQYIRSHQYEKIIYVSPPLEHMSEQNMSAMVERYEGFLESEKESNKNDCLITQGYMSELVKLPFETLKNTAILCSNDMYAIRILNTLSNRDIKIPKDVGLMGFDGLDMLEYIKPKITSTKVSFANLGKSSVDAILRCIDGDSEKRTIYVPHVIQDGQTIIER